MNNRIQELYKIIKDANDELDLIRKNCPHNQVSKGDYMWAPGHISNGFICDDCGKYIGEMKTAKEWIENPRYSRVPYDVIKENLLEKEYSDDVISWDEFEKLTNYDKY